MSSKTKKKSYLNPKHYVDENGYKVFEFFTKEKDGTLVKHINKNIIDEKFYIIKESSNETVNISFNDSNNNDRNNDDRNNTENKEEQIYSTLTALKLLDNKLNECCIK